MVYYEIRTNDELALGQNLVTIFFLMECVIQFNVRN